jgi:hypothetical protein
MARVRRQAAEWVELIDQWQASGLGLSAFCDRNGLNAGTMSLWIYKRTHKGALDRARRGVGGEATAAAFVPVRVMEARPEPPSSGHPGVEVVLGQGRRVTVAAGFDAETLRRVVAVLEGRAC